MPWPILLSLAETEEWIETFEKYVRLGIDVVKLDFAMRKALGLDRLIGLEIPTNVAIKALINYRERNFSKADIVAYRLTQ